MRKIVAFILLLALPNNLLAAVAFVQGTGVTGSGTVASVSKTLTVSSGNAIVVIGGCERGYCTAGTVYSDDRSQTYTVQESGSGYCPMGYSLAVAAGSTTVTLTPNVGSDDIAFGVAEFSGVNSSPADGNGNNIFGTAADPTSPSITTSASGVTLAVLVHGEPPATLTEGGGYTLIYENENFNISTVYKLTSAGSQQASWTAPAALSNGWETCIMGLKAAATAGRRPIAPMVLP